MNLNAITRTPVKSREELLKQVHRPTLKLVKYGRVEDEGVSMSVAVGGVSKAGSVVGMDTWDNHLIGKAGSVISTQSGNLRGVGSVYGGSRGYSTQPTRPLTPPGEDDEFEEIDPNTGEPMVKNLEIDGDSIMSDTIFEDEDGGVPISECEEFSDVEYIDAHTGTPLPAKSDKPAPQQYTFLPQSATLKSLQRIYAAMDMKKDPYVLELLGQDIKVVEKKLQAALDGGTYCRDYMKALVTKSTHLQEECGTWAADWFISGVVDRFLHSGSTPALTGSGSVSDDEWEEEQESSLGIELHDQELLYLRNLLEKVQLIDPLPPVIGNVTEKVPIPSRPHIPERPLTLRS